MAYIPLLSIAGDSERVYPTAHHASCTLPRAWRSITSSLIALRGSTTHVRRAKGAFRPVFVLDTRIPHRASQP